MPASNLGPTAGILLAAGASRRMGTNKMLLELGGEALVTRAARRMLGAGVDPLIVVAGFEAERVTAALRGVRCQVVLNPDFTAPTSTSLHAALGVLPPRVDAVIVMLGDMVQVTEMMICSVLDRGRGAPEPLVVSRYGEVTAPPLLFRRPLFPELLAWHGEGCGKQVVRAHMSEAAILDWPEELLQDVDTPEDFAAAQRR